MDKQAEISKIISLHYPSLEDELLSYVETILFENIDVFDSIDEVRDSVEGILAEVDPSKSLEEINNFYSLIFDLSEIQLSKARVVEPEIPRNVSKIYPRKEIKKTIITKIERQEIKEQEDKKLMDSIKITHEALENSTNELFSVHQFNMAVDDRILFKDSSFSIEGGKRYGLVGSNGTGKSMLLKAISMKLLNFHKSFTSSLVEEEIVGDETRIIECFVTKNEEKNLINEFRDFKQSKDQSGQRVSNRMVVLTGLGFTESMLERLACEFSGGWRMKISLAKVLIEKPDLLLLDGPSNMLDNKTVEWLQVYLKNWKKSLIFVSHDKRFLNNVATDILHVTNKWISTYAGQYNKYIETEITGNPSNKDKKEVWRFPACQKIRSVTVETTKLKFSYNSLRRLFHDINLRVEFNSKICIIGDNGSGKTTLLKLFLKRIEPDLGNVYLHDKTNVGYFSQHHVDQLDLSMTSLEILEQRYPNSSEHTLKCNLVKFGINEEDFKRPIKYLSSGQKSRVAFTIIFMKTPNFIVFDEPTCHLDGSGMDALEDAVKNFNGGVIIVTHDNRIMTNVCNDLWYINEGVVTTVRDGCIV